MPTSEDSEPSLAKMNEYDRLAWAEVIATRDEALRRSPRRFLPQSLKESVNSRSTAVVRRAQDLPGADQVQSAISSALETGTDALARAANGMLSSKAIVEAYQARGNSISNIADIRRLELRTVDDVKPNRDARYLAAATGSGIAAGLVISGGELVAAGGALLGGGAGAVGGAGVGVVPGAGAGAAPGTAAVLTAMAGDAAAVVLASTHAIFHTAQYYGYDTNQPGERLRALAVLSMATAVDAAAKQAAYRELNKLVHLIVRNAVWAQIDRNVVAKVLKRVLLQQTTNVTKRKLGGAVPVAGIVIGAGFNFRMLSRVTDAAELYYRERFLRDKYGISDSTGAAPDDRDGVVDLPLTEIVEEELGAAHEDDGGRDVDSGLDATGADATTQPDPGGDE